VSQTTKLKHFIYTPVTKCFNGFFFN